MRKAMMIVAMVAVVLLGGTATAAMDDGLWAYPDPPAATKTWVGGSGTAWETPANWSGGGLPGAADDVEISAATVDVSGYIGVGGTAGNHCRSLVLDDATLPMGAGTQGISLYRTPGPGPAATVWQMGGSVTESGSGIGHVGTSGDYYLIDGSFQATTGIAMQQRTPGYALFQIMGGSFELTDPGQIWSALMMSQETGSSEFGVYGSASGGGPISVEIESMALGNWWYTAPKVPDAKLVFGMDAGGVTPITVTGSRQTYWFYIDTPMPGIVHVSGNSDLIIDWSGLSGPIGNITLIDIVNSGGEAYIGGSLFTNAPEGTTYEPWGAGNGLYSLTYTGGDGNNDLVLVEETPPVPEPAGLGLIGLALLAVRKRRS